MTPLAARCLAHRLDHRLGKRILDQEPGNTPVIRPAEHERAAPDRSCSLHITGHGAAARPRPYSQPASEAIRTASIRLRSPSLVTADAR